MVDEVTKARLLDRLSDGEIKTTAQLMADTGLCERELRRAIHGLRLAGCLICSRTTGGGGYWATTDTGQLQAFVRSMTNRGRAVFAAASPARRASRE